MSRVGVSVCRKVWMLMFDEESKLRAITNTTLDYQRNQKVCLDCGHTRGVHYGNTPYKFSEGENHCARCITSKTTCRGFTQAEKEE